MERVGGKRQKACKAYVPTESQRDEEEKGKGKEEKSADEPDPTTYTALCVGVDVERLYSS